MRITLSGNRLPRNAGKSAENTIFLVRDSWNDWFQFETTFLLHFAKAGEKPEEVGLVKIGEFGLEGGPGDAVTESGIRAPELPNESEGLSEKFFSLGQDVSYYEFVASLDPETKADFLVSMRDVVADADLMAKAADEPVMNRSLMRSIPRKTIQTQFRRLLQGGDALTSFEIAYHFGAGEGSIEFAVSPRSTPPTNVHAVIGRNGVGKSRLLDMLATLIVAPEKANGARIPSVEGAESIASVISVAFSAFDAYGPVLPPKQRDRDPWYDYVGLKRLQDNGRSVALKNDRELLEEALEAVREITAGARGERLGAALATLEADPQFADFGLTTVLADESRPTALEKELDHSWDKLSSGHKIVLLTTLRLVQTVDEQTLVLIDEPEAHLHPPLLSSFLRALSDLLSERNGVAIVATHSPVVLQEVPSHCVWKLSRAGWEMSATRPSRETFGENTGRLTDDVFGLEVDSTGFHKMLAELVLDHPDYDAALQALDGRLGSEGRLLLRTMFSHRKENTKNANVAL